MEEIGKTCPGNDHTKLVEMVVVETIHLMFSLQCIAWVTGTYIRLHEFEALRWKNVTRQWIWQDDDGEQRKPASPFFKEWYVSHKRWKLWLWHLGHGTEEGPTITSCFEEPKNPSFKRASDVFCITWSFHLQIVVSLTLTLLKSFLQDL